MAKYMIRYGKIGLSRYISHLDFLRTIMRAMRRAALPLKYSEGFNPHPLLSFAAPIALGLTSETEFFLAELTQDISEAEVMQSLKSALPDGIDIISVSKSDKLPEIARAEYYVTPEVLPSAEQLDGFLSKESIFIEKKSKKGIKQADIRKDIFGIILCDGVLKMTLSSGNEHNLKPMLAIEAMNLYIPDYNAGFCRYHRKSFYDINGNLL